LEKRCRNADPAALDLLANAHHENLVCVLRHGLLRRGADPDQAEDVAQTVWCKLLEEEDRLRVYDPARGSFLGYLIQLAKSPMRRLSAPPGTRGPRMVPLEEWADGLRAQTDPDPVVILDFLNTLTPTKREFCRERLSQEDQSDLVQPSTTARERQLKVRVSRKWQEYQQGD
jgi:DNA-directed RNA polymerase specialized sigma24 family protein